MSNKIEGIIVMLAALLVLFSSMLNPMVSMVIAVAALIALGTYHFLKKSQ